MLANRCAASWRTISPASLNAALTSFFESEPAWSEARMNSRRPRTLTVSAGTLVLAFAVVEPGSVGRGERDRERIDGAAGGAASPRQQLSVPRDLRIRRRNRQRRVGPPLEREHRLVAVKRPEDVPRLAG